MSTSARYDSSADVNRLPADTNGIADAVLRPIRVVIAEDSYLIREVLVTTLNESDEVELVAICSNGKELRTAVENWHPDVVMTDIRMPPSRTDEGIRVAADLRESAPQTGVVVLSQYAEPSY